MNRVEKLIIAAQSPSLNFLKYTRARARSEELPIFIFEGIDDPKYYTPRITYRFQQNWRPISVNGKDKVLELRNDISSNPTYSDDPVCFFIDKDFDEITGSKDDLYVTPQYSVENFYIGSGTVRQLIVASCGLSTAAEQDDEIVELVISLYEKSRECYIRNKNIRRANFAYLYIRKSLSDKLISLDGLFDIKHNMGEFYNCQIILKNKGQEAMTRIDKKDIRKFVKKSNIAKCLLRGNVSFFRGKQELNFLREFIHSIRSDGQVLHKLIFTKTGRRLKFKNSSIGNDILSDLSLAALTPKCLADFLDSASTKFSIMNRRRGGQ